MLNRAAFLFLFIFVSAFSLHAEIRVVVFDFGGVVAKADREPVVNFYRETLHLSENELRLLLHRLQTTLASGGTEEGFWCDYAQSKNIELSDDWFIRLHDVYHSSISPIPGTLDVVKDLQRLGYQTAMLSDIKEHQAKIVRELGYYEYFQPVLLSYQIGVEKPDPQAFKILIDTLSMNPEEIIFVDDKADNVQAARAAGIHSITFQNAELLKQELKQIGIQWGEE